MAHEPLSTLTYFTVTPLDANGLPDFDSTLRSTTKADALDNIRVFDGVYGPHGWTQVVTHTVSYAKGRRNNWGKQFSIARYAQERERDQISRNITAPSGWVFSWKDNRYMTWDAYAAQLEE